MSRPLIVALLVSSSFVAAWHSPASTATADDPGWNVEKAAKALDERAQAWFDFADADLGKGETKTTCVSCHTLMPYALARPALRKLRGDKSPSAQERRLLAGSKLRATHWSELAEPTFGLIYDDPEQKRKESLGTEAVFHAAILALDDRHEGRTAPSDATRAAFANLWATQQSSGDLAGAWHWLDFGLEPWESQSAPYFGAALAAIAVGSAPGYHQPGRDAEIDRRVASLCAYLKNQLPKQNLNNQAWALWASGAMKNLLTEDERAAIAARLLAKQEPDGGWRLAALGGYVRSDGSEQSAKSDGYATGLVLHALQTAGAKKTDAPIAKGRAWLQANQQPNGAWRAESPNVRRDLDTHVGKFLSDAATALAVLALCH